MKTKTSDLVKAGLFLALSLILSYIFHATGISGTMFLPMHIPVLLCGFILGSRYGIIVGAIAPIMSFFILGMPPIYPTGIAMACELAAYGFFTGFFYKRKHCHIYISLISSMLLGRLIAGSVQYLLMAAATKKYVLSAFLTAYFISGIWGILIQLIIIPFIVKSLEKYNSKQTAPL